MRYACTEIGFMQVTGHGISDELEKRTLELQKQFFALPEHKKRALGTSSTSPVRGHFGKGGEDLDGLDLTKTQNAARAVAKKTDNKEGLDTNAVPWSEPGDSF